VERRPCHLVEAVVEEERLPRQKLALVAVLVEHLLVALEAAVEHQRMPLEAAVVKLAPEYY